MPLPGKIRQTLEKLLAQGEQRSGHSARGGDAHRLWARLGHFLEMNLIGGEIDIDALELACLALELPVKYGTELPPGKLGRTNVREQADQAAQMLIDLAAESIDPALLERTVEVLRAMPNRNAASSEARLLSDAVNLDDFGVLGLIAQAVRIARQGGGVAEVAEGSLKRDMYGYWEARLKDGFHFEPVRDLARARLEHARRAAALLIAELDEDQPHDGKG